MRKNITAVCLSACVLMSACSAEDENVSEVTAESITEVSDSQTETTADQVKEDNVTARKFAKMVFAELQDNKTSDDPTTFAPIRSDREIPESGFDPEELTADIILLDTNFDGIPELFTGGHGSMGTGRYTVYSADSGSYGNSCFTWWLEGFCIVDGDMYASTGSAGSWGWVKLCDGLPSVRFDGWVADTGNDVDVTMADGSEKRFSDISFDDAKALYIEYLGVDFDSLGSSDDIPFIYVRDVLEVPDTDNYTEEDIYSCLAPLVEKYETMSGAEPDKSDMPDDTAGRFADIICGMTENGDYGAAGSTFGSADVNSDGIPELIRRDSMRTGIEIFDINGNSIWKNSFDPPYEMSLTECTDSKTGEKVFIYSGYTEHANYAYYTAEAICRPEKMTVIAVYDADSGELVKLEAAASDDGGSDIASADISETSYSEEEVREMYSKYFGGYVPVSDEDIWDSIRIELSGEMKDSAFRGELRGHFDELRKIINDALNRSDRDENAVSADKNTSEIIPPDADKISEIFDMRMSETEWKDIEIFQDHDWQAEYEKYLNDNISDEYAAPAYGFDFLYTDIDGDSGYELIAGLKNMNGHSANSLLIYDIIGEKPCCLGKMYGETEVTDAENAPDFFDGFPIKMYRGNGGTKLLSYTEERHGGQYYCIISAAEIGGKFESDIIAYKCGSGDESFYSLEIFGDKISDSDLEKIISDETAGYEEYSSALPEIREMTELNTSQ